LSLPAVIRNQIISQGITLLVFTSKALSGGDASITYNGVIIQVISGDNNQMWTWEYKRDTSNPQIELRYEYSEGGQVSKVSVVDQSDSLDSAYGPEKYMVEYKYDDAGRVVRKTVKDNPKDETVTRYESDYVYDGKGRMTRERVWRYDVGEERMIVTQDTITEYDLAGNPTSIKFCNQDGWAYTESRTYASGYQLTGFSISNAADVSVTTSGIFTYDTNNNLIGTKKLDVTRGGNQLAYRGQWTFTYDRKNRLVTFTNSNMGTETMHLWYDGKNRVWQRWIEDNSQMAPELKRYVYDGRTLVQEHLFNVVNDDGWVYDYNQILHDYLRKPGGVRQRDVSTVDQSVTDGFLFADGGAFAARVDRDTSSVVQRTEVTASGDRQASGAEYDGEITNIGPSGEYIEGYGGGTSGGSGHDFYEPLGANGPTHSLPIKGSLAYKIYKDIPNHKTVSDNSENDNSTCSCRECLENLLDHCIIDDWADFCCDGGQIPCTAVLIEDECIYGEEGWNHCLDLICGNEQNPNCICNLPRPITDIETAWQDCDVCVQEQCCVEINRYKISATDEPKMSTYECTVDETNYTCHGFCLRYTIEYECNSPLYDCLDSNRTLTVKYTVGPCQQAGSGNWSDYNMPGDYYPIKQCEWDSGKCRILDEPYTQSCRSYCNEQGIQL